MDSATEWFPSIRSIEQVWRAVIDGSMTREEAHSLSVRWVETVDGLSLNPIVSRGVTELHGLDRAYSDPARPNLVHHGAPGTYVSSIELLASYLEEWLVSAEQYRNSPAEWHLARRKAFEERKKIGDF